MATNRQASLPHPFTALSDKVRYVQRATRNEYSSSCPQCGGDIHPDGSWPDRFRIFISGKPRCWCRRCGYLWFPDMGDRNWRLDYELIDKWNKERQDQALIARERVDQTLEILARERTWVRYHQNLQQSVEARQWWQSQGIPDEWQDFWQLGYLPEKVFEHGEEVMTTSAYTIPKWDLGWVPKNIDFRLVDAPVGVGKYRPLAGIPQSAFISNPNSKDWSSLDQVFVVEGSKKAMNVSIHTGKEFKQVVGLPSCNSWAGMDETLRKAGRVWVIFDPDATLWAYRFAGSVGGNARIVELPTKPDDAILYYKMGESQFLAALRQGIKI